MVLFLILTAKTKKKSWWRYDTGKYNTDVTHRTVGKRSPS